MGESARVGAVNDDDVFFIIPVRGVVVVDVVEEEGGIGPLGKENPRIRSTSFLGSCLALIRDGVGLLLYSNVVVLVSAFSSLWFSIRSACPSAVYGAGSDVMVSPLSSTVRSSITSLFSFARNVAASALA